MRVLMVAAFFVMTLPAVGQPTHSQTADKLHSNCSNKMTPAARTYCMGFIEGVIRTLDMMAERDMTLRSFCPPRNATIGQLMDVVTKALNDAPQARHVEAEMFVHAVMVSVYPCVKRQ